MKAALAIFATAAALLAARSMTGCASSDDDLPEGVNEDASTWSDAPSDAGGDAPLDASTDAGKTCTADGWCHTPLPRDAVVDAGEVESTATTIDLRDVRVTQDHEAWAVASQGYVFRWKAGAWHLVFNAKRALSTIWLAGGGDIWLGGPGGFVLRGSEKTGTPTFDRVDLGSTDDVLRIRGTSASDVWAISSKGIYRSAGTAFTPVPFPSVIVHPSATVQIADIWTRGSDLWIGAREFTDCFYDDGCPNESRVVLVRWKGDAGAEPDAGALALWERVPFASQSSFASGALSPEGTHFVTVRGREAWAARVARDGGAYAWSVDPAVPSGSTPEGVWAATKEDAWLVASPGVVRRWDGQSWKVTRVTLTGTPLTHALHAVDGVVDGAGKSDVWVVGENIALHRSEQP